MSNVIKGKGQRLIPEELLKYLQAVKNTYPEALEIVTANPTLEGGEDSLSSVLINGTKYAVGGGEAVLEDIVDSAGNKRFIEGNLTINNIEGVTYSYNKWSLSGTHLMIVLVFSNATEYDIDASNQTIFTFRFPDYINDKIVADSTNLINKVRFSDFSNSYNFVIELKKENDVINAYATGSNTVKKDKSYRIQFDLLIDTE